MGDGYCGDEDNGQTSAWYVFSALGFYPVTPATNQYVLGAPLFREATIHLENGKKIEIKAPQNSQENIYVQSLKARLSWQYHHRRAEIWQVVDGVVGIKRSNTDEEGELKEYNPKDQVKLEQGERHRLIGLDGWGVVAEIWPIIQMLIIRPDGMILIFKKEDKESLDKGLEKSSQSFFDKVSRAVVGKSKVDDEVLDDLEEVLISSDVGVETTVKIIRRIEDRVNRDKYVNVAELDNILREEISGLLLESPHVGTQNIDKPQKPYVIMVVGVNGVGKTTTIGKLAHSLN
ncbi:hypothetical protein FQR65_LT16795 [Abscondita terminalis]|nr:hypothetical protein FQR65_LT16795 [Abscondita terminalis]